MNTIMHIKEQSKWNVLMLKKSTYLNFKDENNDKHPKFKVGDHERTSK